MATNRNQYDPFEIPPSLDRRGEQAEVPKAAGERQRRWVMPSQRRVRAMRKQREKENRAIRRALERDMRAAAPEAIVDAAAELTRVVA